MSLTQAGPEMPTLNVTLHEFERHFSWGRETGLLYLFVFLVSRDCCVALLHDATGLSAVCDCGIS